MRLALKVCWIGTFGFVVALEAAGQTVTLPATQDTFINGLTSTTPHGSELAMAVCPGAPYWMYVKFGLSGLAGEVASAELHLTRISGDRPEEISVFVIQDDSWTEGALTGATRPAPTDPPNTSALASGQVTANGWDLWTSAALTSAIRQEAHGDHVLSLMVRENPLPMVDIRYYRTKEAAVPDANKPQLALTLVPFETAGLVFDAKNPATLRWTSQGSGIAYDIVTGAVAELRISGDATGATCLMGGIAGNTFVDPRPTPAPGSANYYLLRGRSTGGPGTYGYTTSGAERVPSASCP